MPAVLVQKKAVLPVRATKSTVYKGKKQSKNKKKVSQEVCFETLTDETLIAGEDCEDEMPWDDPYEKQEREARKMVGFLHSMGDYEGVYKIAKKYYFC
jgi:hypothetical protein